MRTAYNEYETLYLTPDESMETALSAKEAVLKLIERLDDDVTYEEIMYEINFLNKIERGLADVREGRVTSHAQVKEAFKKWLS